MITSWTREIDFRVDLERGLQTFQCHLKDVRLILESGSEAGASLPLSKTHKEILEKAESAGLGALDNSAIIRELLELRREEAALLGYANAAELSLVTKMAESLANYREFGIPVSQAMPLVFVAVVAKLQKVLDLTAAEGRRQLRQLAISIGTVVERPNRHTGNSFRFVTPLRQRAGWLRHRCRTRDRTAGRAPIPAR